MNSCAKDGKMDWSCGVNNDDSFNSVAVASTVRVLGYHEIISKLFPTSLTALIRADSQPPA